MEEVYYKRYLQLIDMQTSTSINLGGNSISTGYWLYLRATYASRREDLSSSGGTMRIVFLALTAFLGFAIAMCSGARAHGADVDQIQIPYPAILECWNIDNAKKVKTYMGNVRGMKLFVMEIDTNEDGIRDGMLMFPVLGVEKEEIRVSTSPAYIVLDTNYDGAPDVGYFDKTMKGECSSLQEIPLSTLLRDKENHA